MPVRPGAASGHHFALENSPEFADVARKFFERLSSSVTCYLIG